MSADARRHPSPAHARPRPRRRGRGPALLCAGLGGRAHRDHERRRRRHAWCAASCARATTRRSSTPRSRFAVDGVSRACTHQLVRHRVASYNQQSQRYVNFSAGDSFVVPPGDRRQRRGAGRSSCAAMEQAREAYDRLVELGLAEGRTRESVQEDARFVLPNAAETKIVVTMNAPRAAPLLRRCAAATAPSGRSARWPGSCAAMVKALAPALFRQERPGLPVRHLPRGQDDLRQAVRAPPRSTARRRRAA